MPGPGRCPAARIAKDLAQEGAGGYSGTLQADLTPDEADALGGVPLIRAALRRAARQLGWRVQTLGHEGERLAMILVHDTRDHPAEFAGALELHRWQQESEVMERMSLAMHGHDMRQLGPGPADRAVLCGRPDSPHTDSWGAHQRARPAVSAAAPRVLCPIEFVRRAPRSAAVRVAGCLPLPVG